MSVAPAGSCGVAQQLTLTPPLRTGIGGNPPPQEVVDSVWAYVKCADACQEYLAEVSEMVQRIRLPSTPMQLEDPRRIRLQESNSFEDYQLRGRGEDVIELAHELTKLKFSNALQLARITPLFEQPFMQEILYRQERSYPLQPLVALPKPNLPDTPFSQTILNRRSARSFTGHHLSAAMLGSILFGTLGETGQMPLLHKETARGDVVPLRSTASAGALHPTGVYMVALQDEPIGRGIYHYDATEHSLEVVKLLSHQQSRQLLTAFPIHPEGVDMGLASTVFLITSTFWRTRAKYGARGYRYCLLEAGGACENLCLTATALGLGHVVIGGFYDDDIHAWLGIDGVDHAVIVSVVVGSLDAVDEKD